MIFGFILILAVIYKVREKHTLDYVEFIDDTEEKLRKYEKELEQENNELLKDIKTTRIKELNNSVTKGRKLLKKLEPRSRKITKNANTVIYISSTFLIIIFINYLFWFSQTIYHHIPNSIGGGSPLKVKFLLKKDSDIKNTIQNETDYISIEYFLISDSGDKYVFTDKEESVHSSQIKVVLKSSFDGYLISR